MARITISDPEYGVGLRKPIATRSAWIDPDGRFYALPDAGHDDFADRFHSTWADALERRGWLHISYTGTMVQNYNHPAGDNLPQCQLNMLFELLYAYEDAQYNEVERFRKELQRLIGTANGDWS